MTKRRSLRGSVDCNTGKEAKDIDATESLPSWECGLKF